MLSTRSIVLLLVPLLLSAAAPAQSTGADPAVEIEELRLRLLPLDQEELRTELDAWRDLLKTAVSELAEARIELRTAAPVDQAEIESRLEALQSTAAGLVSRVELTSDALKAKGGDVAADEAYLAAIRAEGAGRLNLRQLGEHALAWARSKDGGLRWLGRIGSFLATLLVAWIVARIVSRMVRLAVARIEHASALLRDFLVRFTRWAVLLVGFVIAVSMLGVQVGPLVAALGAAGFIVGFAVQGTLSNFAAGLMILIYRPLDIGDFVEVAGVAGTVEAMTIVSTTIKSPDNQTVIIPNQSIWGDVITNKTAQETRRVDLVFGIGYDDDIAKAREILEEIVSSHPGVLDDPAPVVRLHELADSSVNFVVRPWSRTDDYWDVFWDVTQRVKERFDAEGISIPYPQRDVHVHQNA